MLRNTDGDSGGVNFSGKKRYERVRFNINAGVGGGPNLRKMRYVTLEWPMYVNIIETIEVTSYFSGTVRRDPSDGPDRGPRYRPQVAMYLGRHQPHHQLVPQLGRARP